MTAPKTVAPSAVPFGASCIVLDVRTGVEHKADALAQPHLHVPLQELDAAAFLKNNAIDPAQPVYVLCRSGKRATMAAASLAAAGHQNAQVIEGGILACEAAGIPLKKRACMTLERQVRIAAGLLVISGVALGAYVSPYGYALSALVGAGLVFAGVTDTCGLALLLARAPWNRDCKPACGVPAAGK